MKDFDYENFIDKCEFGYELQKDLKYKPVVKFEVVKASLFGKATVLKWYSHMLFMYHIYHKLDINPNAVYLLDNLEFNDKHEVCEKFIVKTIYPDNMYYMYGSYYRLGKLTYEYFSVDEYKSMLKESIKHWIEVVKEGEQRELKRKQEEKDALDKFNKNPFHFIRCG